MPHENSCARVFVSDGFACRHCGRRVYLGPAIKLLDAESPGLELWDQHGSKEPLRQLWATVDHEKSLKRGGTDCLANLVTSCVKCNSSRGHAASPPPPRPRVPGWNGYAECFLSLAPKYAGLLSTSDKNWITALRWSGIEAEYESVQKAIHELRRLKDCSKGASD